ncbi:hypothetical protein GCM10027073_43880 [Streptomyces chlorus]
MDGAFRGLSDDGGFGGVRTPRGSSRPVPGAVDREDVLQAGQSEQLLCVRVGDDQLQLTVHGDDALEDADQDAQTHGVDELHSAQVDDGTAASVRKPLDHVLLDDRHGVHVHLPEDLHDGPAVDVAATDLDWRFPTYPTAKP